MGNIVKVYTTKDAQSNLNEMGFGLEILNEYDNRDSKLLVKCTTCGEEDFLKYSDIKRFGKRCSCTGYRKRVIWDLELIRQNLKDNDRKIEMLSSEYFYNKKLRFRCEECGYEWNTTWNSVVQGTGCAKCVGVKKLTKEDLVGRVEPHAQRLGYEVLNWDTIQSRDDKFVCKCSNGHITETSFASLDMGCGCVECRDTKLRDALKQRRVYAKEIKEELKLKGIGIIILSDDDVYGTLECKCPVCEHEFTSTRNRLLRSGCAVCNINSLKIGYNDIATISPELVKYFVNKEDALVTKGSVNMAKFKCPDCGTEKTLQIKNALATGKYCCGGCSDGISIPNKMLSNILKQSGVKFETEKRFENSNFRYDAYVEVGCRKVACEAQGRQHFDKGFDFDKNSNENTKINDANKKLFVESIGVEYLEIDCRYSDFEHLKENFAKSLSSVINVESIDFVKAYEASMSSKMIDACKLYKYNKLDVKTISEELDVSDVTIRTYLKRGTLLGLCDYDARLVIEESKRGVLKIDLVTGEIIGEYESVNSAGREVGDSPANISRIINGLQGTTKSHTWIKKCDYKRSDCFGS